MVELTHEFLQTYFDSLYAPLKPEMQQTLAAEGNEIYGELLYYSGVELLNVLELQKTDHLLDIGSGFARWIFQVFFSTKIAHVTGIEIHPARYDISMQIKKKLQHDYPSLFQKNRSLNIIGGDFLQYDVDTAVTPITIAYACSTVFSEALLLAMGEKLDKMPSVRKIVSFRKLPNLRRFVLKRRLFLHGTWDRTPCYIYTLLEHNHTCRVYENEGKIRDI